MVEFIYKSLGRDALNTGYKPWNIRKKSHAVFKTTVYYYNKEKTASSELVGVKWCEN